jgi:hypothetical protein
MVDEDLGTRAAKQSKVIHKMASEGKIVEETLLMAHRLIRRQPAPSSDAFEWGALP